MGDRYGLSPVYYIQGINLFNPPDSLRTDSLSRHTGLSIRLSVCHSAIFANINHILPRACVNTENCQSILPPAEAEWGRSHPVSAEVKVDTEWAGFKSGLLVGGEDGDRPRMRTASKPSQISITSLSLTLSSDCTAFW